jgi:hypothetical protein
MFLVANTSRAPKFYYQPVYCCLIRHFLARIRIAKCFTKSSRRFRCEVMFENEHTFCSWIHHVRTCTAFTWAATQQPGWPWLDCHGGGWESLLHGGRPASTLICYRSTWLLLCCVLNCTPYTYKVYIPILFDSLNEQGHVVLNIFYKLVPSICGENVALSSFRVGVVVRVNRKLETFRSSWTWSITLLWNSTLFTKYCLHHQMKEDEMRVKCSTH